MTQYFQLTVGEGTPIKGLGWPPKVKAYLFTTGKAGKMVQAATNLLTLSLPNENRA